VSGKPGIPGILLRPDWDWNRLMAQCTEGTALDKELRRLVLHEGFVAAISGPAAVRFSGRSFRSARQIREAADKAPRAQWAGFDLFYPMPESEIRASGGYELVQGILGAFAEVVPVMNMCMQVPLVAATGAER
jgi:hypothetical protein